MLLVTVVGVWMGMSKSAADFAAAAVVTGVSARVVRLAPGVLVVVFIAALLALGSATDARWHVVPVGAVVGYLLGGPGPRSDVRGRRIARLLLNPILLPVAAAFLACVIDLPELAGTRDFWVFLIIGIVASSDARWVCYYAAIRALPNTWWARSPWSMASRWMRDGATTMQMLLVFIAFGLDREHGALVAALLAGSALVELTRNVRARFAGRLDRGSELSA
jgi:hypothetical protein